MSETRTLVRHKHSLENEKTGPDSNVTEDILMIAESLGYKNTVS